MNITLFIPCFNDTLFPETGKAMVHLFERLGHTVDYPLEQTCCGQMHYNTGYQAETLPMVRHFLDVFEDAEAIVAPSASCVGMIKDFYPKVAKDSGDADLIQRVKGLIPRVFEFSQFIVYKLGMEDVGAYYPHRVTYHPTCHSLRVLHIDSEPLKLLGNVKGIDLVELPEREQCCGFGGTFAVKNAETSTAMMGDKIANIKATKAEVCTSLDNSCLMHIGGGLSRFQSGVEVVHLAEILASTESGVQQ